VVAAAVVGILVAVAALRANATDPAPRRWKTAGDKQSDCYSHLVSLSPPAKGECIHSENETIPPRFSDWIKTHAAVYSVAATPRASPTLRDLGDRGQAEAIDFLEKDSALKGRAWINLKDALSDSATPVGEKDPFRFERVLVASVTKGLDWKPGDRMMWSRVLVEPINFSFAGYTVAATDNETVKVTSVEATSARKFSANIAATIPGLEGPKASVGPSSEHSVKTTSDINAQYEKLGIDILPNFLRIIRESETGGDAVGNTTVSLTAVTDPKIIRKRFPGDPLRSESDEDPVVLLVTGTHFEEDGSVQGSDNDRPAVDVLPQVPVPHCALRARVWMLYEEREVKDGGNKFYDESQQDVLVSRDAEDKEDLDIVSADEVSPAVWSIKLCENPECRGEEVHFLKATLEPNPTPRNDRLWRKVVFTAYGVAMRLAHWLRVNQGRTPPKTGYLFNYPGELDKTYLFPVPVQTTVDECKAEPTQTANSR
jgi:hypothetical protein